MAFDTDKLQEVFKDKRVLIGAVAIGAIAGLYVLSKSSGSGAGSGGGLQPLPPQSPDAGSGSSSDGSSNDAGLAGQIAEIGANQSAFQSQVNAALQAIQDGFNSALGNAQSQNASALQSVIDQVNSQLGSGYQQAQTVPDFAGFQSQLLQALSSVNNVPQRVNETGKIFNTKGTLPALGRVVQQPANLVAPARGIVAKANQGNNLLATFAQQISNLNLTRSTSGINRTVNNVSNTVNRGVPFNLGSSYVPYVQGRTPIPRPKLPTRSSSPIPTRLPTIRKGGGGFLR